MKVLLASALILDKRSPHHQKKKNVLLHNGIIAEVGDKKFTADKVVDATGMILSPGWFDLGCFSGDPGMESKEDLHSLARAAAAGGFTEVAVLPNTAPPIQSKNEVSYIIQHNPDRLVQIHPIASVTRGNKGEDLTEMIDLNHAGAVAFSDGLKSLWHTDIFLKALQYLQSFDGLLIDHAEDPWISLFGQMHEGPVSTALGLKGLPTIAEDVTAARNLELLGYAGGRLHFSRVSSPKTLDLIKSARKKGLQVTCDMIAYQPLLNDQLLTSFDTNYKVKPPLRSQAENELLIKALRDGVVDVLTSGHVPHDDESKVVEFDQAEFGMINLQTFASQLTALSARVEMEELIHRVSVAPRELLKRELPVIEKGAAVNLTLFDPQHEWVFDEAANASKSKNSPWLGKTLTGKAMGVFFQNRHSLNV
ncbi:MAG: dihydroorotase [Cyclobacteriaceae bacterium]